jgi:hypothetical protein
MADTPYATSTAQLWTARILSGLCTLFLAVDALAKVAKLQPVIEGTVQLGYPESVIVPLGIVLLGSTILYAVPATSVLGAILVTGYLGGAVATHVRVGNPLMTHTLFPVWLGILLWGGLWLRDARLRALLPVVRG